MLMLEEMSAIKYKKIFFFGLKLRTKNKAILLEAGRLQTGWCLCSLLTGWMI